MRIQQNYTLLFFGLVLVSFFTKAQNCNEANLVINQNFNQYQEETVYTESMARNDFSSFGSRAATLKGFGQNSLQTTRVENGVLKAEYLENSAGGSNGGFIFDSSFADVNQAILEYKVKFDDDFFWATGGKLPGLGGGAISAGGRIPVGCVAGDSNNQKTGFSCRLMWRTNIAHTAAPRLVLYSYLPHRAETGERCGKDDVLIRNIKKEEWYTIKQQLKLNDVGKSNGIIKIWINNELVFEKNDVEFRLPTSPDTKINALVMHTYRGGNATDQHWWSPKKDFILFDDFKVWTSCNSTLSLNTFINESQGVKVFPNPALNGKFHLSKAKNWQVYSLLGAKIAEGKGISIDISNAKKGIYFLRINGNTTKKLFLE